MTDVFRKKFCGREGTNLEGRGVGVQFCIYGGNNLFIAFMIKDFCHKFKSYSAMTISQIHNLLIVKSLVSEEQFRIMNPIECEI